MDSVDRNIYFYLGLSISLVFGLIIILIAKLIRHKTKGSWCYYDERQLMAQGKAYKYSFLFCIAYFLAFACFQGVTKEQWIDNFEGIFFGIILSVFIFAVYAIWKDAYISIQESPKKYIGIFGALSVLNLIPCVSKLIHREALEENRLNLLLGLVMLTALVVMVLKQHRDKKREDAE